MNKTKRTEIFTRLRKLNPHPTTELNFSNEFELLISVILSAQATDISVNKAIGPLFNIANTPEAIFKLGETKLKAYVKTIGLYNTKASNIIKTCNWGWPQNSQCGIKHRFWTSHHRGRYTYI